MTDPRPWLRRFAALDPDPAGRRVRLVCFPHAGGTASTFQPWATLLAPEVEVVAVQYPGRQDRAHEPCAVTMDDLVSPVVDALEADGGGDLALLGHSMGAAVALEVTRALEQRSRPVHRLFVSGRRAPHLEASEDLHSQGDAALLADVERLGATDVDLDADPDLREILLGPLRADYRLIETYRPVASTPVRTPVTALTGDDDPDVSPEQAAAWSRHTSGDFRCDVFPGGHFYLTERPVAVVRAVLGDLHPGGPATMPWPSTP